jgi:hypothetical protein
MCCASARPLGRVVPGPEAIPIDPAAGSTVIAPPPARDSRRAGELRGGCVTAWYTFSRHPVQDCQCSEANEHAHKNCDPARNFLLHAFRSESLDALAVPAAKRSDKSPFQPLESVLAAPEHLLLREARNNRVEATRKKYEAAREESGRGQHVRRQPSQRAACVRGRARAPRAQARRAQSRRPSSPTNRTCSLASSRRTRYTRGAGVGASTGADSRKGTAHGR